MKLKLSCADFTFPLLPTDPALDLIAMLGFDGVDLGVFAAGSQVKPEHMGRNVAGIARSVSRKLRQRGLALADVLLIPGLGFEPLAPNHPSARERQRSRDMFLRSMEFVAQCNGRHLSALPGVKWKTESEAASLQRSSDELGWRVARARAMGIVFAIEPHFGSIVPTPDKVLQLVQMTPGLTLCLDYGHFTYQGFTDREIEPLVPHASHFHARGAARRRMQMSMKENTIDFAGMICAMRRGGYRGYIGCEYCWDEWHRCNEVDTVSETILLRNLLRKEARHAHR